MDMASDSSYNRPQSSDGAGDRHGVDGIASHPVHRTAKHSLGVVFSPCTPFPRLLGSLLEKSYSFRPWFVVSSCFGPSLAAK